MDEDEKKARALMVDGRYDWQTDVIEVKGGMKHRYFDAVTLEPLDIITVRDRLNYNAARTTLHSRLRTTDGVDFYHILFSMDVRDEARELEAKNEKRAIRNSSNL